MTREPAVAGQFYPSSANKLRSMLADYTPDVDDKTEALGVLTPHAGYVFSGATAGKVFGRIQIPDTVVVLNPSHQVRHPACALWTNESWETPLGEVPIQGPLCDALEELPEVTANNQAHQGEHAGEVVVPFLQYHNPDVRICVLCITTSAGASEMRALGEGINEALAECGIDDSLVVASSDMSHERGTDALETVKAHDPMAVEKMEQLDPEGLIETCRTNNITMCGVLPAAAMMASVQGRGGIRGEVVDRATSADSPHGAGNYVVGYAGMIFN